MRGSRKAMAQLLAMAGLTALVVSAPWLRPDPGPLRAQSIATCEPQVEKTAFPAQILLGQDVRITLGVSGACEREQERPLHVVVAIDVSGSMSGKDVEELKRSTREFIRGMRLDRHPGTRIAIVSFNDGAREHCGLSSDPDELELCLNEVKVRSFSGTDLDAGITVASRVLADGRRDLGRTDAAQGIALLSDGGDPYCANVRVPRGLHLAAVCATGNCNESCMRGLASKSNGDFRASGNQADLAQIFGPLQSRRVQVVPNDIRITDTLPLGYAVDMSSVDPPASYHRVGANGQETLIWRFQSVRDSGMHVSFSARPSRLGMQAANEQASVTYRDDLGLTVHADFPIPYITVFGPGSPTPPASPTPEAASPSPAPPEATPSPRPALTRLSHRAWLPYLLRAEFVDAVHPFREP